MPSGASSASSSSAKKKRPTRRGGKKKKLVVVNVVEPKTTTSTTSEAPLDIEYVPAIPDDVTPDFMEIFKKFQAPFEAPQEQISEEEKLKAEKKEEAAKPADAPALSRKQRRLKSRLSIAELKRLVQRPEVVEVWDVTSSDPKLLVFLKSYRNAVPVPRHWKEKRKYLQGKRGLEKSAYQLPDAIAATGISRIREALQEKEDKQKLKSKQREKMQPKMNKVEIDYQCLHDAFFKHMTKPKFNTFGDLYYEGKEFEIKMKEKRPGCLSAELRAALGMPENAPPPWLIYQQRHGPPPSYPELKIPGLNSPLPHGASYGYHPGGWGKPPIDQFGRPLYGDPFGAPTREAEVEAMDPNEKKHWGILEEEEEEEEEEEQEEQEEDEEDIGTMDDGIASVPTGLETPDVIELRKVGRPSASAAAAPPASHSADHPLYQVLEEKEHSDRTALLGSSHVYVIPKANERDHRNLGSGVEVALNPNELESLDEQTLAAKYEQRLNEQREALQREDVSDLVNDHLEGTRKQAQKRKQNFKKDSSSKKAKEFKF